MVALAVALALLPICLAKDPWQSKYAGAGDAGFVGVSTFAHLPVKQCLQDPNITTDIAILGHPFDGAVSFRPGARFGPYAIRSGSRRQAEDWAYGWGLQVNPYQAFQFLDCGDVPVVPYDPAIALDQIYTASLSILQRDVVHPHAFSKRNMAKGLDGRYHPRILNLGGDHTIALPILHALSETYGPITVIHFDAHLDTYRGHGNSKEVGNATVVYHGNPFSLANARGYLNFNTSIHAGIRSRMVSPSTYEDDRKSGFQIIHATDIDSKGTRAIADEIRARVGSNPVMISLDIDVLDPAYAPATGTPESGGWTTRELHAILQGLKGLNIVSMDIVEVAPAYDTAAEITAVAAADFAWDLLGLLALGVDDKRSGGGKEVHGQQATFAASNWQVLQKMAEPLYGLWV